MSADPGQPRYPAYPREEHDLRVRGLQSRLVAAGLDGVVLNNAANVAYYAGFRPTILGANLVWTGLVVPAEGQARAIVSQPLANLFIECSWLDRVQPFGGSEYWGHPRDPIALTRQAVVAACGARARLGLERSEQLGAAAHEGLEGLDGCGGRRPGLRAQRLEKLGDEARVGLVGFDPAALAAGEVFDAPGIELGGQVPPGVEMPEQRDAIGAGGL